jgi:hypothetical protein
MPKNKVLGLDNIRSTAFTASGDQRFSDAMLSSTSRR